MGWKGNLKTVVALSRSYERDSARKRKFHEQQRKNLAKMQELEAAAFEVEEFENYLELIQSVHKDCGETVDWKKVASSPMPLEPKQSNSASLKAELALKEFNPGFLQKLLGGEKTARKRLELQYESAKRQEEADFRAKTSEWKGAVKGWQEMVQIANGVIAGDHKSYLDCVEEMNPFEELSALGSSLKFTFHSAKEVTIQVFVHDEKVIPKAQKALLKTGKLSIKEMPNGKRNEIYQDYVCSAVLRVGREMFALLPISSVIVNANGDLLNPSSGHLESQAILSVLLVRETMDRINFESIDPSDCMRNFRCNMNFKKGMGMSPVESIKFT